MLFTREIVKKEDHLKEGNKVNHEKKILGALKKYCSPFIAKFYHSEQTLYKSMLFIDYCPQKSLHAVRARLHEFMSLNTKLMYLKQIAQGIKFLKDHEICHLDIKPTNILVSGGILRLSDFG